MAFPFPPNPVDGQQVSQTQPDGSVLVATYHQAKNEWIIDRKMPAPTTLTGAPPINVTASADGQVITWDQALGTWTAKAPASTGGGVGGTFVKATQAAADTANPPSAGAKPLVAGMLQTTLENLHKELKVWDGTAWAEALSEDTIKAWISAGSLFRGVVKEATLNTLPAPATANRGYYFSWTGAPGHVVTAADPGIGTSLAGEILQVGDWVQSDGTKWVHVPGDLLSKQRWDSLGSFAPWSDTSWEKGSVVSYQQGFWRANALISPGDDPPEVAPGNKWSDITPHPSIKLAELADVNDNVALSGDDGVLVWSEIDGEFVVSRDITVDGIEFAASGPGVVLEGFCQDDLELHGNLDGQAPSCKAVVDYVNTRRLEDLEDTKGLSIAVDGEFVAWDAASNSWKPKAASGVLAGMTDVDLTTPPTDNQLLIYDATAKKWSAGEYNLVLLDDVNITTPADGNLLKFDGKSWVNWIPDFLSPTNGYSKTEIDSKLTGIVLGLEHEASVLSRTDIPPTTPAPVLGDTYIVGVTPTGAWVGHNNHLARWNGTAWDFADPKPNESHLIEDVAETWHWNGTNWVKVAVAQAAATSTGELWQVGSIQQSLLTETQWAAVIGPEAAKWVLADGRNVAGSKYATVTGQTNVPDLRGSFIRCAGQNNNASASWNGKAVGSYHNDTTALPKTAFVADSAGGHTHTIDGVGDHHHVVNPNRYSAAAGSGVNPFNGGGSLRDSPFDSGDAGAHTHTMQSAGAHTHTISGGDVETAPVHFSLNTFIKIN